MVLVGERKALAAGVMAFFTSVFLLNGLLGMPELMPLFVGLTLVYGVGFFGLAAGWFWARWYASGVAASGVAMGVMLGFQIGLDPLVYFWTGTHAVALLCLLGAGPAGLFDGRIDWREKWQMDEVTAHRLGKAVQRAGASLPYLVMAGFAPKQGMAALLLGAGALILGAVGVRALVRLRTWGALALAGAAGLAAGSAASVQGSGWGALLDTCHGWSATVLGKAAVPLWAASGVAGVIAAVVLTAAVVPLVGPALRYLRGR